MTITIILFSIPYKVIAPLSATPEKARMPVSPLFLIALTAAAKMVKEDHKQQSESSDRDLWISTEKDNHNIIYYQNIC